jgi:outer membrane protein assembly factor BamE (lipoprotein component of BamABCDE complex)
VLFNSSVKDIIMSTLEHFLHTRKLALALAAGLGLASAAQAGAIAPADKAKVQVGESQAEVRQDLGDPTRIDTYLFAKGSTWLYKMSDQPPDNEQALRVVFSPDGKVTQVHTIDAGFVGLE